ncbi:MAG: ubiquinone/menaquinone biosynthesis methyltransferase [Anaerolineae bacterium]|nr:ubiquinone/menaquinone biosynthesis methyltransferase [Anaerolineae bacterium]
MSPRQDFRFTTAGEKRAFTRTLFDRIAPRYELLNVIMSMGRVGAWRRAAAAAAQAPPGGQVLDVATGTGGLAAALARRWPAARVVGVDFSPQMLRTGRARFARASMRWVGGDALRLPFPAGAFDAVVNGFMLRNVVDVEAALAEQARVVRPGGHVVCLEMTWPRHPLFRPLFRLYFYGLTPWLGGLLTGYGEAYRYLPHSVEAFCSPEELAATMERVGLHDVRYRRMMMGTVTLHVGERPG